jgi:hypothetical protein
MVRWEGVGAHSAKSDFCFSAVLNVDLVSRQVPQKMLSSDLPFSAGKAQKHV